MVAISFSEPKHYDKLINREKMQTIRPRNPKRIEQMKRLGIQIYWKQRTPEREKLYDAEYDCGFVIIFKASLSTMSGYKLHYFPYKGDIEEIVAKADGFDNFFEMVQWFENRYGNLDYKVFDLIRWIEVK